MAAQSQKNNPNSEQDVDVLYQRLGNTWFAFSIIDDEVFMAPVSEDEILEIKGAHHEAPRNQAA